MSGRRLEVEVPMVPPYELSPNASRELKRGHRTRIKDEWATTWGWAIRRALREQAEPGDEVPLLTGPVRCDVTYYRPKGGKTWDEDNLIATLKHGLDQLQQLGVVGNDRQLRFGTVEQPKADDGIGWVRVTLTEEGA